jgi:hypothetical protein
MEHVRDDHYSMWHVERQQQVHSFSTAFQQPVDTNYPPISSIIMRLTCGQGEAAVNFCPYFLDAPFSL